MKRVCENNTMIRNIINNLLPQQIDNTYQGKAISLIVFIPLTMVTIARSLIHIFSTDGGAQSIATIPLDSYSFEASQAVVTMFALWGLSQFLLAAVFLLTILRYRSLLPLMYMIVFIEYIGRHIIMTLLPIETLGNAPGSIINLIIAPIAFILMLLAMPTKTLNNDI